MAQSCFGGYIVIRLGSFSLLTCILVHGFCLHSCCSSNQCIPFLSARRRKVDSRKIPRHRNKAGVGSRWQPCLSSQGSSCSWNDLLSNYCWLELQLWSHTLTWENGTTVHLLPQEEILLLPWRAEGTFVWNWAYCSRVCFVVAAVLLCGFAFLCVFWFICFSF